MFGLEKDKNSVEKFDFDLEVEIKENPEKGEELVQHAASQAEELKKYIRTQEKKEDFDDFGVYLHGYAALGRVLKKVLKSLGTS